MGYSSDITLLEEEVLEGQTFPLTAKLLIHPEDSVSFNAIRRVLWFSRTDYKLFSQNYGCFIPKDPELIVEEIGEKNKETNTSLARFNLKPVFFYQKTKHYYAVTRTGSVAIINPYLLGFIYKKEIPEQELEELSFIVAPNLKMFSGMFEKKLVPTKFYEYYHKDLKIINESYFDIKNHKDKKVFIKPLIFEFDQESFEFYTYAGDSSSSLLFMDKIRPGEDLNKAILRILREELKIADDYIAAHVIEYVEFDRDKEGVITPRLILEVYVGKIKNKDWAKKMSQTSWRSLDG